MAVQTFIELGNQYDGAIATGVNRVIANGISGNADTIAQALTLYILIVGGLISFGEMSWPVFCKHLLRAGMIAFLMTAAGFNTLIADPAMNTIPAWIAQVSNNATGVVAGAEQFELLWSAVKHQESALLQQAVGIENLGYRIEAGWLTWGIGMLLQLGWWAYEFSRLVAGLLVAALPFVLFLYLFETTRGVPMRIAHKLVGIFILQLLLSVLMQIMMQGDASFMAKVGLDGALGPDEQLGVLENIFVFFCFGIFMLLTLPAIAAYIGGGIALNAGSAIVNQGIGLMTGGVGAANQLARSLSRRLRR